VITKRLTALRQGRSGRWWLLAFLVAAVLGAGLIGTLPAERVLIVEDIDTGKQYLSEPVDNGTIVALEYTHSVEKSRVYDRYRVEGTTLVNTRMEFESYGWGLPARVNVTNVNGTLVYAPEEPITELEQLLVSPGRVAGHTLIIDGTRHDLVAVSGARDVRLHIDRRPLIERIL
jgi:hypothetical protein